MVDPKGKFVYVANSASSNVSAFKINATSGALNQVSGSPFAAGYSPIAVVVDPTGKFAFVANQSASASYGNVSVYQINATSGALSQISGSPFGAGSSPNDVVVDPTGKFAYVPDYFGRDVYAYKINATTGALTAVFGSPFSTGLGSQDMVVDPTGKFAYVVNRDGDNVSAFQINTTSGALSRVSGSPFATGNQPYAIAACRVTSGKCIPAPL